MTTNRFLRWRVGDARITRVVEIEVSGLAFLVPEATRANLMKIAWLDPGILAPSGEAVANIQSFVIESHGRRILVDTCAGPERWHLIPTRIEKSEPLLDALVRAGFVPDAIDTVACTHLHFDHLGWNTRTLAGRRTPTFANARYVIVGAEWEFWSAEHDPLMQTLMADSIRPLLDAGLVELVAADYEIAPGVRMEPSPGHTPGHVSVRVVSGGMEAMITGDLMHHPAQVARPEWTSTFDFDPDRARETRLRFLNRHVGSDTLVIGTHFAGPTAGRIVRDGASFRFKT